jgi:superfamily I DNA and/or RNA helicase
MIANNLLEQSRMHPAIGELVSNTFYKRKLVPSDRVKSRELTIKSDGDSRLRPIVCSRSAGAEHGQEALFEQQVRRSFRNEAERRHFLPHSNHIKPIQDKNGRWPTLVLLSPYLAQVEHLERILKPI